MCRYILILWVQTYGRGSVDPDNKLNKHRVQRVDV